LSITTIAAHVAPGVDPSASLLTPFALAEAFAAHLTALVFDAEPPANADAAAEERTVAAVRAAAERRGVACEVRGRSSFAFGTGEVLADHLRVSDLGVLAVEGAPGAGQRFLIGSAVFATGRPVLLSPAAAPLSAMPRRVIVAWDASPAAVRAVHGALPFITRAEETLVVSVTDDTETRPGQSGVELTHLLARHGAQASFLGVPRAGSVLATLSAAARDRQAGLLVMGAVRHAPLRDLVFGGATRDLMDRGPSLPTLLAA
jgi:nucleotide-binding universal stress UspA family protein